MSWKLLNLRLWPSLWARMVTLAQLWPSESQPLELLLRLLHLFGAGSVRSLHPHAHFHLMSWIFFGNENIKF